MNDLIMELGLVAVGAVATWLVILASQWSRRARLRVCLDREEVPREVSVSGDIYDRDVVLTVRNLGLGPVVDCVGRLERLEYVVDGEWKDVHYTAADLEWRGTGGARNATIPSDAPPRQHLLLQLSKHFDLPFKGRVC